MVRDISVRVRARASESIVALLLLLYGFGARADRKQKPKTQGEKMPETTATTTTADTVSKSETRRKRHVETKTTAIRNDSPSRYITVHTRVLFRSYRTGGRRGAVGKQMIRIWKSDTFAGTYYYDYRRESSEYHIACIIL